MLETSVPKEISQKVSVYGNIILGDWGFVPFVNCLEQESEETQAISSLLRNRGDYSIEMFDPVLRRFEMAIKVFGSQKIYKKIPGVSESRRKKFWLFVPEFYEGFPYLSSNLYDLSELSGCSGYPIFGILKHTQEKPQNKVLFVVNLARKTENFYEKINSHDSCVCYIPSYSEQIKPIDIYKYERGIQRMPYWVYLRAVNLIRGDTSRKLNLSQIDYDFGDVVCV